MYGKRKKVTRLSKPIRRYGQRVTSASVHTQVFSQSFDRGRALWADTYELSADALVGEYTAEEYEVPPEGWPNSELTTGQSFTYAVDGNDEAWLEDNDAINGGRAQQEQNGTVMDAQNGTQTSPGSQPAVSQPSASTNDKNTRNGMESSAPSEPAKPSAPDEAPRKLSAAPSQPGGPTKPETRILTQPNEGREITDEQLLADIQSIISTPLASSAQADLGEQIDFKHLKSRNNQAASTQEHQEPPNPPTKRLRQNDHAIFDRIAQSMSMASTYDMGSVALQQRFDSFDRDDDAKRGTKKKATTDKLPLRETVQPAQDVDEGSEQLLARTSDFVHDLDLIKAEAKMADTLEEIPLDPGVGGRSIGESALVAGDIILSTTDADISRRIRAVTGSEVSHAAMYLGDNKVIEAIEGGVTYRSLDTALADDTLAVAYRHRDMTPDKARAIVKYAEQLAREQHDFDHWALIRVAPRQLARSICNQLQGVARQACLENASRLRVGTDDDDTFYCSELVLHLLQHVQLGISILQPSWSSPDEILGLQLNNLLVYIGHLKA